MYVYNFTDLIEWLHFKDYKKTFDTIEDQKDVIVKKKLECYGLILAEQSRQDDRLYCNITWDGISCWPATPAGIVAVKPCPDYINMFLPEENVTRRCNADGTWFVKEDTNKSWSDYTNCVMNGSDRNPANANVPNIIKDHMDNLTIMVHTGYGLSLASLVVAVLIMLYFKKLHCPRNTIHLNLFLSFILRALLSFIKYGLFIEGVGFTQDVDFNDKGEIFFIEEGSHWECRLFMTIVNYSIAASYAWICVEALYLQALISVAVFTEKKHLHVYMLLGWTLPLSFMIPWVATRSTVANRYCWTTYDDDIRWVEWIIHGPILITIVINFIIFINIVRVLFTKLNASPCPETKKFRYRRLAKSTLVLIPLFGVYYLVFGIIFVNIVDNNKSHSMLIYIYLEMFFNSFQGFFLSLLFCFFNSEVQNEFKKAWRRYTLSRSGSSRWRSTFTSRTKSWKDHRNSESNGVAGRGDKIRPNEEDTSLASPMAKFRRSPITQTTTCDFEGKSTNIVTENDIEIAETTPWLNNNHTALVEQHVNSEHADESL